MGQLEDLLRKPETSIEAALAKEGFTPAMVDRFFRPFLGGIFFDRGLGTSSRLFDFVMRMLAVGSNCLPAGGIGAVSEQLAGRLPADAVLLGARVEQVVSVLV
jgi:phytoene dehydrogenase-like protein